MIRRWTTGTAVLCAVGTVLYLAVYYPLLAVVAIVAVGISEWKRPRTTAGRWLELRRDLDRDGWAMVRHLRREPVARRASTRLGHTAVGPKRPVGVRVGYEQSVGVVGGPRTGKSMLLGAVARGHRGPAVVSSRRFDLLLKTIDARRRGGAVLVFAPVGLRGALGWLLRRMEAAGWLRFMHWDLTAGCEDATTARNRAAALVDATDGGASDDSTWLQSATALLACLLRAAAFDGLSMVDVFRWITSVEEMNQAYKILLLHAPVGAAELASEVLSANERGAASVMRATRLAVAFMALPDAASTCCPCPDGDLDVARLLREDGTLYLVSSDRKRDGLEPLMAALTDHVWTVAVQTAEESEEQRLPRPLLMDLDEIAVTAKTAIDEWLAIAGGYNIHIFWAAQNFAQLRAKWGEDGARSITSNSSTLLAFGGLKDPEDLRMLTDLCGPDTIRVDQVRGLPKFRAVTILGGCAKATLLATPFARAALPQVANAVRPLLAPSAWREIEPAPRLALPAGGAIPIALPPVGLPAAGADEVEYEREGAA